MMRARPGIALLLALFTILLLQLLAAGVLALATLQKTLAQTRTATARAELAARAAPGFALDHWAATTAARLPDGGRTRGPGGSLAGASYETSIERLSGSAFLIRVSGRVGDVGAPAAASTAGFLVHTIDPDLLAGGFPAALATGGSVIAEGASRIDGASGNQPPPGWPAARCEELRPLPTSSTALVLPAPERLVLGTGGTAVGVPAITTGPAPSMLTPDFASLAARADHTVSGELMLAPRASAGQCDYLSVENWGAPLDPRHPCFDYFPVIHAPGDLQIQGGSGQGTLLVEGDLTISGASFNGVIVVLGRLILRDNTQIRGAVSNLNSAAPIYLQNSAISRCECSLRSALQLSHALSAPTPRPGRSWVPVY